MDINDCFKTEEYDGRILGGNYSMSLKKRINELLAIYCAFEKTGNPAMPYISAWQEDEMKIWYEFTSSSFIEIMKCAPSELADVFRNSVVDRIIYRHPAADIGIEKKVFSSSEITVEREKIREEGKKEGIDAVYKITRDNKKPIWLKDVANVETYKDDRICLSIGSLTVVTNEMRAEEERVERERLLVLLQMAGAVCHELSQPMQAILGYTENTLLSMENDNQAYPKIKKIQELVQSMGDITKKLMNITRYETKDYVKGVKIIDIDKSSEEQSQLR